MKSSSLNIPRWTFELTCNIYWGYIGSNPLHFYLPLLLSKCFYCVYTTYFLVNSGYRNTGTPLFTCSLNKSDQLEFFYPFRNFPPSNILNSPKMCHHSLINQESASNCLNLIVPMMKVAHVHIFRIHNNFPKNFYKTSS